MNERKPNILIVMTDEQNPLMSSVYGHPFVKTPNMQRLADRGVTIESAYCTSPTCVASRASFMTGRYPHQIGVYDLASPLSSGEPTWAHMLNAAGYETVLNGKMHFIGPDQRHGFSKRPVEDCHGDGSGEGIPNWDAPRHSSGKQSPRIVKGGQAGRNKWHEYDYRVRDESVRYLKEYSQGPQDRPFALCASFISPHFPLVVEEKYFDMYYPEHADLPKHPDPPDHPMYHRLRRWFHLEEPFDPENVKRCRAAYYGLITFVDELFGTILDTLDQTGLADNTFVLFTSDHGEALGERGMWWKSQFLEDVGRVPLICAWPRRLPAGERRNNVASLVDVVPTLLDVAGAPAPGHLSGTSFLPLLEGDASLWRDEAFIEYLAHGTHHPQACVRHGKYKYIYSHYEPPQLFDLEADPEELVDLGRDPAYADVVRQFEKQLLAWWPVDDLDRDVRLSQQRRRLRKEGQPPAGW